MYYLIFGGIFLLSLFIQNKLQSKMNFYSRKALRNGLSGKEIAEKMLRDNGIHDVQVISTPGQLTDHYNPENKTVNLSDLVYNQRSAAAAAVAAHESGHAVQHAKGYSMLQLRSKLVPIVSFSSKLLNIVLLAGVAIYYMSHGRNTMVLAIAVLLFGITTLFAFITLPVEYDASNRALQWLKSSRTVSDDELSGAQDALKWAARTYVVAALGSLAQFLYYLNMLNNSRRD